MKDNHFEFRDSLAPDDLNRITGTSLAYMIRTRVTQARVSSDDSNIYTTRIFPPPGVPREVQVSVTEPAIVLTWLEPAQPSGDLRRGTSAYRAETESGQQAANEDISHIALKTPLELRWFFVFTGFPQ